MPENRFRGAVIETIKLPYRIGRASVLGVGYTIKGVFNLVINVHKIPGAIDYINTRVEEYKNNQEDKNRDFLEDIKNGRFALAQIRAGLFDYDINYSNPKDGVNVLMMSVKGDDTLVKKFIISHQSDLTKTRVDLSEKDNNGDDVLIHAVKSKNIGNILFLIKYPELLQKSIEESYFVRSSKDMLTTEVREKLKEKIFKDYNIAINHQNNDGMTALMYATSCKEPDVFKIIIRAAIENNWNIDTSIKDKEGKNIFHHAAINNNVEVLKYIQYAGMDLDINSKDNNGNTPLDYANMNKSKSVINEFLGYKKYGARNKSIDELKEREDGIVERIQRKIYENIMGRITSLIADNTKSIEKQIEKMGDAGQYVVSLYNIYRDREEIFLNSIREKKLDKILFINMVDINCINKEDGKTALMLAVESKDDDTLNWVISNSGIGMREIDVNMKDKNGNTALILATKSGYDKGVNAVMGYKLRSLRLLVKQFRSVPGVLELLIGKEIRTSKGEVTKMFNEQNNDGKTALMVGIESCNPQIVKRLIRNAQELKIKIDWNLKDKNGDTALGIAVKTNNLECAKVILHNDISLNAIKSMDGNLKRPIQLAVEKDNYEMAKLLIGYGARVRELNYEGKNMMDVALDNGCSVKMRKLIRDEGALSYRERIKGEKIRDKLYSMGFHKTKESKSLEF